MNLKTLKLPRLEIKPRQMLLIMNIPRWRDDEMMHAAIKRHPNWALYLFILPLLRSLSTHRLLPVGSGWELNLPNAQNK